MPKSYLTVRDTARKLELTEYRVRQLIREKQIRATKIKQWRIMPRDLEEIILNNWEIFEPYFIDQEQIENKLEELEIPRNIIAHNRVIPITELHRIDVYASDLKRCMNREVQA